MSLANITFLDIETVSQENPKTLSAPPVNYYNKFAGLLRQKMTEDEWDNFDLVKEYADKSGLYAEFAKIVCISIGKFVPAKGTEPDKFYIRTIVGRKEDELLKLASESILKANGTLCAHNGLEFDFPFLMRRYMIHGIPVPPVLDVSGKKPWDINLIDTMKMWSGTAWNYKVSLELLANIFGLPSPKTEMDGSSVAEIYYDSFNIGKDELPFEKEEAAMKKIGDYCNADVFCMANCYAKMKGLPIIREDQINYV